jgi:hypothetical protein
MVQLSHALGAFKTWEPILQRRLQPNLHTRVTNVTLSELAAGERSEGRGECRVTYGHSRCECSDPAQKKFNSRLVVPTNCRRTKSGKTITTSRPPASGQGRSTSGSTAGTSWATTVQSCACLSSTTSAPRASGRWSERCSGPTPWACGRGHTRTNPCSTDHAFRRCPGQPAEVTLAEHEAHAVERRVVADREEERAGGRAVKDSATRRTRRSFGPRKSHGPSKMSLSAVVALLPFTFVATRFKALP